MRRIFIAACIASGFTLCSLSGSPVSNDEWTELMRTSRCSEDLIVLTNGSKLCGKLTELPPLSFTFGTLSFKPDEIAAIGIISRDQQIKVQYMTYDGQNFIGSLNGQRFVFALRDTKDQQHFIRRELEGSEISFILLAKTTNKPVVKNHALFHISLQNGDHLSARIESGTIHLSDGWNDSTLDPQNIVEVCFNGGLQGEVINRGLHQELGYRFVKEPTISVQVPRKDLIVRLPWQSISTIQIAHQDDEWPEDAISPQTHLSALPESSKPAAIGNTFGRLLTEASGAINVPPQMFATLDTIGSETFDAPDTQEEPQALFTADEEESWTMHIAFNDEPVPLFDDSEEPSWGMNIAFEEDPPSPLFDDAEEDSWLMNIAFENSKQPLFDHREEDDWEMTIAFEDDLSPHATNTADFAMLDERELNDLYKRYDMKISQQTEEESIVTPGPTENDEDDLDQILAALDGEGLLFDDQEPLADIDETMDGFFITEDYIVLPGNIRDRASYHSTFLPTSPEPLLYTHIPSFYIDETPVSNRQYAKFIQETGHTPPKNWENSQVPAGRENDPVTFVSYDDAAAYAAWAGRRLPNEMEWSLALEKGLIIEDPSLMEWTNTSGHSKKKVVIQENGTLEAVPTHIERNLSFRTVAS